MPAMDDVLNVINTLPDLRKLVNDLLIVLSPKEKHIIEQRFSLNGNGRATLEKIGGHFNVTRERIRQIEKNALRKLQRNVGNTQLSVLNEHANALLQKYHGLLEDQRLVSEVLALVQDPSEIDVASMKLSIELDPNVDYVRNTIHFRPYFQFASMKAAIVHDACNKLVAILRKEGDVLSLDQLTERLQQKTPHATRILISSCIDIDRRMKRIKEGIGLSEWRHINPRTLRDKIHYILRHHKKPMHYVEISNAISESCFDNKTVNTQAVHNELIRHDHFVLIGRGIYALKEWGYEGGTVSQVIERILRKHGPMHRNDITEQVLKQRQVKKITILLNLKNKKRFERVGRDRYQTKR